MVGIVQLITPEHHANELWNNFHILYMKKRKTKSKTKKKFINEIEAKNEDEHQITCMVELCQLNTTI